MKKLITLALFLISIQAFLAQTASNDYYKSSSPVLGTDNVSASVTTGSSVTMNGNHTVGFSTYVAPKVGYQLTPKFKISAGMMRYTLSGNVFSPALPSERMFASSANAPISSNLFFVRGEYQLQPKLSLTGMVVRGIMTSALGANQQMLNFNSTTIGVQYKISDKASIGIGTTISNGNGTGITNPMSGSNSMSNPMLVSPSGMFPMMGQ